jgi:NADH:ubiquinone oxidoreductase subunit E
MKLPISGGPRGPSRPPTHPELDAAKLMRLGVALEDAASGGALTTAMVDELSQELGVDASRLFAAAALTTELAFANERDVQFAVCVGGCQGWGALACVDALVEIYQERDADERPLFDIVPKRCLDRCSQPPAVMVHTRDGVATLPEATPSGLADAVAAACADS